MDNVFFAPKELDAKLFAIYKEIQKASASTHDEDIVIDNVLLHSDAYLYALKTLIRASTSHIRIFTRHLDQRMVDGTPLYSDPDIIDALNSFLNRPGARLEILFRQEPAYDVFKEHLLLRSIGARDQVYVYCATNQAVRQSHSRFITFDGSRYNLRYRNYAIINFNNEAYARDLIDLFERIKEMPTTFRKVPGGASIDEWDFAKCSVG